jgi:hypothetical protein
MPIFLPRIPVTAIAVSFPHHAGSMAQHCRVTTANQKQNFLAEKLSFYF